MQLARIIGSATSTVKHAALHGWRLAVAQPLGADRQPDGDPQLVVDPLGSAEGQTVLINSDGKFVREVMRQDKCPARFIVCAIVNE